MTTTRRPAAPARPVARSQHNCDGVFSLTKQRLQGRCISPQEVSLCLFPGGGILTNAWPLAVFSNSDGSKSVKLTVHDRGYRRRAQRPIRL